MSSKTVLITGASRGIGAACAEEFAHAGFAVVINYHKSVEQAKALEKRLCDSGAKALAVRADVSKPDEVEALFQTVEQTFGGVDILINNAGISRIQMLCDTPPADWENVFSVNTEAAYLCAKRALSHMVHEKWGRIINISSMWGLCGASCEVAYSASKAALIGFTKALAKELAPSGITVNAIAPGFIDTDMNRALSEKERVAFFEEIPIARAGKPEEVAYAAAFLADRRAAYITGQVLAVDGGITG